MDNLTKKLQNAAGPMRLTSQEKSAMRAQIFGAPSPVRVAPSPYVFLSHRWMQALAVCVLFISAGGTTVFASAGALPGDLLYPLKVNVSERIELALAPHNKKAEVEEQLAERRVEEAQSLHALGRLDATTTQELEDSFDEHASHALALAPRSKSKSKVRAMAAQDAQISLMAIAPSEASDTATTTEKELEDEDELVAEKIEANIEIHRGTLRELKLRVLEREHEREHQDRGGEDH